MSLTQSELKGLFSSATNEWYTPQDFFNKLDNYLKNHDLTEFGAIGFNILHDWHDIKDWNGDEASVLVEALNVSPPLGIKARKIVNAESTLNYNRSIMDEMNTFDIDNPMWSANTSYIEALTNAPLNRLYNKTQNVRQALDNQHAAYQRVLMFSGWSQWNIGLGDSEKIEAFKKTIKEKKKIESKIKSDLKKEQEQAEEQKKIDDQIEKEKQQEKEGKLKDPKCSNVNSKGKRCNISVAKAGDKCTIHESVPQNETGKKTQCKKIKE